MKENRSSGSQEEKYLRLFEQAGKIRFSVRDNEPGIPKVELPFVFERFWQAKETAHLGIGLGLYISKGIVKAHQGRIWVESEVGKGSAFYFEIPK